MDESLYIKYYPDVLQPTICELMINTYEKLWKEQEDSIRKMSLCYDESGNKLCGACDCQRLDIMQHKEFVNPFNYFMERLQSTVEQYKLDVDLEFNQWPKEYGYEHIRIKRYLSNEVQQHGYHSDVNNIESAKRFLAVVCYLNDDFDGGQTVFPKLNYKSTVSTGGILLFPATWNYYHRGLPSKNGYAKYILGTFLNYTNNQRFNRAGDKILGMNNG